MVFCFKHTMLHHYMILTETGSVERWAGGHKHDFTPLSFRPCMRIQVEFCFHQPESTFQLLYCEQILLKWKSIATRWKSIATIYKTGTLCTFCEFLNVY